MTIILRKVVLCSISGGTFFALTSFHLSHVTFISFSIPTGKEEEKVNSLPVVVLVVSNVFSLPFLLQLSALEVSVPQGCVVC